MIVAEFRVIPLGEGTSMDEPLERVEQVLKDSGIRYQVGPLGTVLEAESAQEIFDVVRACHTRLRGEVDRVITHVTLDERLDKPETAESLSRV